MEKYKLKLTFSYFKSKLQKTTITRSFVWEKKEDALACKELMGKAITHSEITMEFVAFTDEVEI